MERVVSKLELKADDIALAFFLLDTDLQEHGWETVFDGEIIGMIEAVVCSCTSTALTRASFMCGALAKSATT